MPAPTIAANWKMNTTLDEAVRLAAAVKDGLPAECTADVYPLSSLYIPAICKGFLWTARPSKSVLKTCTANPAAHSPGRHRRSCSKASATT